MDKTLVQRYLI